MNKFTVFWFNFWKDKKWIFGVFVLVLLGLQIFFATSLEPYEDITKTLPQSEKFEKYAKIIDHNGLNRSLYFSLTPKNEIENSELSKAGQELENKLIKKCGDLLTNIRYQLQEDELEFYDYLDQNLPLYLDSSDYDSISQKISPKRLRSQLKANHEKLYTPEGFLLKNMLMRDPLQLNALTLKDFEAMQSSSGFIVEDGLMMMPDKKSLFVTADLDYNTAFTDSSLFLQDQLSEIESNFNNDFKLDYFSSVFISTENSKQVKRDTTLTLWVSLSGILFLLFFYYRNAYLPFFFVLPAIFGILFALCFVSFVQTEVSAISLGASAIVLGIIMDYSFHFFTHLKHSTSVKETLQAVSNPLFIGCFTTILAFAALQLTNSPVLQDFGLFAAFSLLGAVIAVNFILPVLLPTRLTEKWQKQKERNFQFTIGKKAKAIMAVLVVAFSIISFIYAPGIQFDDDLLNLTYLPKELKESEQKFRNINPQEEKRIFVLSEASNKNVANQYDYQVQQKLDELYNKGKITSYLSSSAFRVPDKIVKNKLEQWNSFWDSHKVTTIGVLDSIELELGYYKTAFNEFEEKISGSYQTDVSQVVPLISNDLNKLVDQTKNGWIYVSYYTVHIDNKEETIEEIESSLPNSDILDRSGIASALVATVQDDFNFVLLASSLLVFVTLLIVYGRIELALITFIPMVLSWFWILGAATIFDIKFNFVNIIICTFIFGLGDDFAIFITDGYVQKFARNKNFIQSYKRGILLSATTTIIGTGSLIFAHHPAINSIALISVIGMVSILIISFTVQPFLLKAMLTIRKSKGLPPVTLINFVTSVFAFTFFLSGCLLLYPIQLLFRIIPFGQKQLKLFYHRLMQIFAWLQVYLMVNVKKKVHNKERLDFSKPSVIIANHQSFIDILMIMTLHPKVLIMTNDWVYNSPFFGAQIKYLDFFPGSAGVEENLEKVKPLVEEGYSVVIFPEGTRSKDRKIKRFHKGAFYIAEKLNLDITPIMLHGFNDTMRKNDFILQNGTLNTVVLPRISNNDLQYGEVYKKRCKNISRHFKEQFKRFDLEHSDSKYLQNKVLSNYIFKSPFIEWYIKVKWWLERKNFDQYHELLPVEGKIMDLGCGLGYLSYYLNMRAPERNIVGIDYDEEKIEIAKNCYSNNNHTSFVCGDLKTVNILDCDGIILYDVLHYLPAEEQKNLLEKCADGLNKNGALIIRDGITDLKDKHKRTELTEKYSTKTIGFNKTENNLCFFSKDFIFGFAEEHDMNCEMKAQKKSTSNTVFVLKHK